MQIALRECKNASGDMEFLEEIWFAFFEKSVFNSFVEAAEEMLDPFIPTSDLQVQITSCTHSSVYWCSPIDAYVCAWLES